MGLMDRIKQFLKPLPQQSVMDRKSDIDPTTDPRNTLSNPGETTPNPSLAEDVDPMGPERRPPHE